MLQSCDLVEAAGVEAAELLVESELLSLVRRGPAQLDRKLDLWLSRMRDGL